MIEEICIGSGILVLLLVIVYLLLLSKPFKYTKRSQKGKTSLIVEARKNLSKVTVVAGDVTFERKRIKEGRTVEFDYPTSRKPAKLIVVLESGRVQTFEI